MSRYVDSSCKLCRREGMKLFLKGARCATEKCAFERRGYVPGMHRRMRSKPSDYCIQLREKQKVKRLYRLQENQFRNTFKRAEKMAGIAGQNLIQLLERRLDNMVYRIGFASSRAEARQMVRHNHILVNGKPVNIPSYFTRVQDEIAVAPLAKNHLRVTAAQEATKTVPAWLARSQDKLSCTIKSYPERKDITIPINEHFIVELYSK